MVRTVGSMGVRLPTLKVTSTLLRRVEVTALVELQIDAYQDSSEGHLHIDMEADMSNHVLNAANYSMCEA